MNDDHHCDTCQYHRTTVYRVEQLERDYRELHDCYNAIKKDIATTQTNQAVLTQRFKNLEGPLWIVLGGVLIQLAKWAFSFIPVTKAAAAIIGGTI